MINGMKMIRTNMPGIKKALEILDLRFLLNTFFSVLRLDILSFLHFLFVLGGFRMPAEYLEFEVLGQELFFR